MGDKKTAQYGQLIDDLRETRRVIGDAKMKLHDLIDRIDMVHDIGSMPDGVYELIESHPGESQSTHRRSARGYGE